MSDRQILEAMLYKHGIVFDSQDQPQGPFGFVIEAGYCGFYSSFQFDKEGQLLAVEAYE